MPTTQTDASLPMTSTYFHRDGSPCTGSIRVESAHIASYNHQDRCSRCGGEGGTHALLDGCSPEPWHGPTFARLFFEMIVHYERVPAAEIRRLAVHQKPRRVWFAEAADCPKRVRISAERRRWEERLRELQEAVAAHKRAEPTP